MKLAFQLFLAAFLVASVRCTSWDDVDNVLSAAVADKAFPGCVAVVGGEKGILYSKAFGNFVFPGDSAPLTPGVNPPMTLDTIFDIASLSKVAITTTATAQLYEAGYINLDDPVTSYLGSSYASHPGKDRITIRNLMLHNAGYPPDPTPGFIAKEFGCPATSQEHPPQDFTCQVKVYQAIYDQDLVRMPGVEYDYSDLSMMTMMYVIGRTARQYNLVGGDDLLPECVARTARAWHDPNASPSRPVDQCFFEAYVRLHVVAPLGLKHTGYLPSLVDRPNCAPTENDTYYRHEVVQGAVHDENAYASGGIQGHAAVFTTAMEAATLMHRLLFAAPRYNPQPARYLNETTVKYFTTVADPTFSSRALGWDLCGDPDRMIYTVFFTNRVYPTRQNMKIAKARTAFNTAVQKVVDGQ
ncbi:putative Beta-lactamase [Paratrimastix pyriformis]|uniref:Beta-lactamase n=1 Tax=Paratrimastix pyriformis TaxID=342808 RepID=A0ABQ8UL67_9EUKA|nr:putative Beta-lactamase [Paratrimastix pyriformis]